MRVRERFDNTKILTSTIIKGYNYYVSYKWGILSSTKIFSKRGHFMKKAKVWKWVASIGTSLLFLFTFIFSMIGGIGGATDGGLNANAPITAEAADASFISYPNGKADLGRYRNGYTYAYTSNLKYESMHKGEIDDDTSSVVVDSAAEAGSQKNPFVIADTEDWENFVKKIAGNYGASKYFILGDDIDFDGVTFHPAYYFSGTLYGMGHYIRNITVSSWQTYTTNSTTLANVGGNNYGYGLFCGIKNATITDLIVDNYSYQNMPANPNGTDVGSRVLRVGGISGRSDGTDYILNCHTLGEMTSTVTYSGGYGAAGGIVGMRNDNSYLPLTIYRCTALMTNVVLNHSSNHGTDLGGMVGDVIDMSTVYLYDCAATVYNNPTQAGFVYGSPTFGYTWRTKVIAENVVGNAVVSYNKGFYAAGGCAGLGYYNSTPPTVTLKNIYGWGTIAGKPMYAVAGSIGTKLTSASIMQNLNTVKAASDSYAPSCSANQGNMLTLAAHAAAVTNYASTDGLWVAAKNAVGDSVTSTTPFYSKIWDASKIGNEDYAPENSPVRNFIRTAVTYWNYKGNDTADQYDVDGNLDYIEVKLNDSLASTADIPALIRDNREFVGWTNDVTGTSEPFNEVIPGLVGDVKLYAVWKPKNYTFGITATGTGADFATDTTLNEHSMTYNTSGIKLQTNLSVPNMTNPKITYQWLKGGANVPSGGTSASYTVRNVRDSGDYGVTLKFHDSLEPLFMGKFTSDSEKVTIKPAKLDCMDVKFEAGRPYSGAPYETATPTAVVRDSEEKILVNGETRWKVILGKFNNVDDNADNIHDGKETKVITFIPDEEYQGNYGEAVDFEVTFPIEYLTFTFHIPKISNLDLVVNLEYGQHYTYNNVVTMFEEVFEPYLSTLAGNTPAFVLGEQIIKINDFRKKTG